MDGVLQGGGAPWLMDGGRPSLNTGGPAGIGSSRTRQPARAVLPMGEQHGAAGTDSGHAPDLGLHLLSRSGELEGCASGWSSQTSQEHEAALFKVFAGRAARIRAVCHSVQALQREQHTAPQARYLCTSKKVVPCLGPGTVPLRAGWLGRAGSTGEAKCRLAVARLLHRQLWVTVITGPCLARPS